MDPDAKVQVSTLGTKLEFSSNSTDGADGQWTRVYGLASTPDFGGQPNTIDSTTLDNTVAETSVQGLMPATEVNYQINVQVLNDENANLRKVKALADAGSEVYWRLTKHSGVVISYKAKTTISYNADEQASIEKFTIYHDLKSDIKVTLPEIGG